MSINNPNKHDRDQRISEIESILRSSTKGLTKTELAHRLKVHKSTIGRDILFMEERRKYQFTIEKQRYRLNLAHTFSKVQLSIYEIQALHLATRLYAATMRFPFPYAVDALRKLAEAQKNISNVLASQVDSTADELAPMEHNPANVLLCAHIELLTKAIHEQRIIQLVHHSRKANIEKTYRIYPGTIEPYANGMSVYLWALCFPSGTDQEKMHIRVFKLSYVESITLMEVADKDCRTHYKRLMEEWNNKSSWGLWYSNKQPQKIKLRFSVAVAGRVRETLWHTSQQVEEVNDGTGAVFWTAMISGWEEIIPWVRGWGRDVEVLEHQELKEFLNSRGELYGGRK